MKFNRILIPLFIILLLIIGIELYFLFSSPFTKTATSNDKKCGDISYEKTCSSMFPSPNPLQAIKEAQLMNFRVLKKGIVKKAFIDYTYEGVVSKVVIHKEVNKDGVELTVISKEDTANSFVYVGLSLITVKSGAELKPGLISDVKLGSNIKVRVKYDLLSEKYESIQIEVLK